MHYIVTKQDFGDEQRLQLNDPTYILRAKQMIGQRSLVWYNMTAICIRTESAK